MSMLKCLCLAAALGVGACASLEAQADSYVVRQYYSGWHRHTGGSYYYRTYYYKPTPRYVGYRHHYVIYHPRYRNHYYYYNPYKKVYWGRCPVHTDGRGQYSHLAEADRRATLEEIPETAFPKLGPMPKVPESDPKENVTMDLPPDDLPSGEQLPKVSS
jgi:hypothetical protein